MRIGIIFYLLAKYFVFGIAEIKILFKRVLTYIQILLFLVRKRLSFPNDKITYASIDTWVGTKVDVTCELQYYLNKTNDLEFNLFEFTDFVSNMGGFKGIINIQRVKQMDIYWIHQTNKMKTTTIVTKEGTPYYRISDSDTKKVLFNNVRLNDENLA